MAEIGHDAATPTLRSRYVSGNKCRCCGTNLDYVADLAERAKRLEEALRAVLSDLEVRALCYSTGEKVLPISHGVLMKIETALASKDKP